MGVNFRTRSVASVLYGGISFATPSQDMMGDQATQGSEFTLHSESKTEWFDWRPSIPLPYQYSFAIKEACVIDAFRNCAQTSLYTYIGKGFIGHFA